MTDIGSESVTDPHSRWSGSPTALPNTSQMAVSTHAIAWSARPRSRRMLLVEGSMARPGALGVGRAAADDPGRQLVVDDAHDERMLVVRVAVVDLRHQPVRGVQAGDDGRPVDHGVGAADEPPGERRPQGDGLDALDAQRAPVEDGGRWHRGVSRADSAAGAGHRPAAVRAAAAILLGRRQHLVLERRAVGDEQVVGQAHRGRRCLPRDARLGQLADDASRPSHPRATAPRR